MVRRFRIPALGSLLVLLIALMVSAPASAVQDKVLILSPTVTGAASSLEAVHAASLGLTVDIVGPGVWSSMSTSDFAEYRAIILGDPTCGAGGGALAPAAANAATWASAVTGNVVVVGTDPIWHSSFGPGGPQGGDELTRRGIDFAVADAGKTGAYVTLSCYYHGTAPGTPVPALDGFGSFTVKGVGCHNDVKIVATHPALSGLTDANLSNWSCSVHEAFDSWPISFEVLAMSVGTGDDFTAPDGTRGTPYILARGVQVISDITLSPGTAENPVGTSHTLTATVTEDGTPLPSVPVTFTVIAGPHAGTSGNGVTGVDGTATFSYTGTSLGTDTIEAGFVDSQGNTQRSNRVEKTWVEDPNQPPDCTATPSSDRLWPPNHSLHDITVEGVADPDGDAVTITVDSIHQDEPTNTIADGNTTPDGFGVGTETAQVRAERAGSKTVPGNGRVYHIGFSADDGNGGTCSGTVLVSVPHDQGQGGTAVDDGPLYDSTV